MDIRRGKEKIDIVDLLFIFASTLAGMKSRERERERERETETQREKERKRETFSHVPKAVTFSPVSMEPATSQNPTEDKAETPIDLLL